MRLVEIVSERLDRLAEARAKRRGRSPMAERNLPTKARKPSPDITAEADRQAFSALYRAVEAFEAIEDSLSTRSILRKRKSATGTRRR
jgi:hypothetical protein